MAISTFNKFGVPTQDGGGRGGILQPKYKYRFRVVAFNFGVNNPGQMVNLTQQVMTVARPSLQQAPVAVHAYNSIAYFAGKHEWQTVTLKVRDDITNSVSGLVSAQVQKQMNHLSQRAFAAGAFYKFNLLVQTLDGSDGTGGGISSDEVSNGILEEWFYEGCFLSDVNWGEFDYAAGTEIMDITMTIRFDNATQGGGLMPDPVQPTRVSPFLE